MERAQWVKCPLGSVKAWLKPHKDHQAGWRVPSHSAGRAETGRPQGSLANQPPDRPCLSAKGGGEPLGDPIPHSVLVLNSQRKPRTVRQKMIMEDTQCGPLTTYIYTGTRASTHMCTYTNRY